MYHEIERKFLVNDMPSLRGIRKVPQERYFIQRGELFEEGMKRKGNVFTYESKFTLSKDEKSRDQIIITKEEFETSKSKGTSVIERDSYSLTKKSPVISIKKYKGEYSGLILAEVEFDTVQEMEDFVPLDWMGSEVTHTPLGKDAKLVDLSREKFKAVLYDIEDNEALLSTGNFL